MRVRASVRVCLGFRWWQAQPHRESSHINPLARVSTKNALSRSYYPSIYLSSLLSDNSDEGGRPKQLF